MNPQAAAEGVWFPNWAEVSKPRPRRPRPRLGRRNNQIVAPVSLWAKRAWKCGFPERFAQPAPRFRMLDDRPANPAAGISRDVMHVSPLARRIGKDFNREIHQKRESGNKMNLPFHFSCSSRISRLRNPCNPMSGKSIVLSGQTNIADALPATS
jgi:hypothetical protein